MILSLRLYQRYCRWVPTERSDIETIRLGWYQRFLALVVVSVLAAIVWFLLGLFIPLSYWDDWILRAIVAFNICFISFNGYIQVQPHRLIFDTNKLSGSDAAPNHPAAPAKKAEKPDPAEVQNWCRKVETLMQSEKLYLNPELTLSELAEKLQTHNSWISYVINTGFQKNFNDFVNAYRVADFQKKVNDHKLSHYTLLALAFECGFNSKSTFNRAVKKATGQLPSTFGTKIQQ